MKLFDHQKQALAATKDLDHVAYYHDMGLGKTYTGSEKLISLKTRYNLVVCQKSKIEDWYEHFKNNYDVNICDLTKVKHQDLKQFIETSKSVPVPSVYVINYDLIWRRPELKVIKDFTLLLDESSLLQNETSKRSKFILKLQPKNVILLSGTPTGGKYENLWSQMHLLGWKISKEMFFNHYVDYEWNDDQGFMRMIINGYKNEERLKRKMRQYGCHFLKTEEVFNLPDQIHQTIKIPTTKEYKVFKRDAIVKFNDPYDVENEYVLAGDSTLKKMLYERQLCGQYNSDKIEAFRDLLESTNDRLIVFYNFNAEIDILLHISNMLGRDSSIVNGSDKDLYAYEEKDDSVTFIQYQSGAMGLNLQKANKIIYFTPPLSSELFEQSKKRIHRIGQQNTCFYYYLTCRNSIEEKIYRTLEKRKDYTEALFEYES